MTTRLGSTPFARGGCRFLVWAPFAECVEVELRNKGLRRALTADDRGYHEGVVAEAEIGDRYLYHLDDRQSRPDPASRYQPEGVHGPSEIVAPQDGWKDEAWSGRLLQDYVIYEMHVGTFTREGTFVAAIDDLDRLVDLGITAVEIMPVAQFPGTRNWGYDGVYPFAVQDSYGGPAGLRRLVEACHARGLAVVLDVVYNHFGPEGNYLREFGPYFTHEYHTPWGDAINLDGAGSDEVRRFFIENALMWLEEFHIDALRLDAVHALIDRAPYSFLTELTERVDALSQGQGWKRHLIAESDANDPRLIMPVQWGGHGLDGVWSDDFHHAVHALLTGERHGYYVDYGNPELLTRALRDGFGYTGQYSRHRGRRHGAPAEQADASQFVVCVQNHDQVGNRLHGERLSVLVPLQAQKLAAGLLLLAPQVPLVFMGEEYGETHPFLYFVSHGDPELVEAVRRGRKREFAAFGWQEEPVDAQDPATFERCRLQRELRDQPPHQAIERLYRRLLQIRKQRDFGRGFECGLWPGGSSAWSRWGTSGRIMACFNLKNKAVRLQWPDADRWYRQLGSCDPEFGGEAIEAPTVVRPGQAEDARGTLTLAPYEFALFALEEA